MDWNLVWGVVGGVGGLAGIGGFVTGAIGIGQAHRANKIAQDTNTLAQEANDAAAAANELAETANKVSNDANTISQRALSVTADQTEYHWVAYFERETSDLVIVNDCALDATDVTVVIRDENGTIGEPRKVDIVPGFGEIPFHDDLFLQKYREDARRYGNGFYGTPVFRVTIHLVWTSERGIRRTKVSKQGFGSAKRKDL
ncbi:MAG: hypothetical protein LKJ47_04985 [Bifidobacteriaceae bacterium]|jgi:hypothetical protein|nr:hypothetical protein [Bifidobacteriaceae bacterium]